MERADGASFRTADTVPGASPTRSATALRVTVPGSLIPDFFLVAISIDDRRIVNCGRLRLAHASGECNFNPGIYDQRANRKKRVRSIIGVFATCPNRPPRRGSISHMTWQGPP